MVCAVRGPHTDTHGGEEWRETREMTEKRDQRDHKGENTKDVMSLGRTLPHKCREREERERERSGVAQDSLSLSPPLHRGRERLTERYTRTSIYTHIYMYTHTHTHIHTDCRDRPHVTFQLSIVPDGVNCTT